MEESLNAFCKTVFYPVLHPIFEPFNAFLSSIEQPYFTICAIGMFVLAMVWVGIILREPYVNRGRPVKSIWTDLRLWTVISMLPHVFVYFYFY